ncbi:hypothetical protein HH219_21680 [Pseudoalteromonas sp. NEC-BIFX-2020_015]|uniref:hypothetical protein n=1 Tax=Pseudoalteromonas sp. NEC-BIFX-2020_015 TaxID=2729544 RepID=UPI00146149B6|nr:hypothetical protein [Pseudoalteromonas sp. NEC-BIFX-2020_015]NMR28091.1 hypothetical protein [Pseudoalteromonas sp. NEC-BIFX-2020_015]
MRKLIVLCLFLSNSCFAVEQVKYCPDFKPKSWEQMKESEFSKEAAKEQLRLLNQYFNGEIEVAEEFLYQANIILEGSFLKNELLYWQKQPEGYEAARQRFCKFLEKKAWLVH